MDEPDLEVVAFDDEELEGEEEAFDPYAFIKGLPPLAQCTAPGRRVLLPRQTRRCKRKTLVRLRFCCVTVHSRPPLQPSAGGWTAQHDEAVFAWMYLKI